MEQASTPDPYEYDVAFSFLAQDESIACEIKDLLEGRVKTFIYSERQRELAGRDGVEEFSRVFGTLARVVVILYRPAWGTTPWTRIEETAIKDRTLADGHDFLVLLPLDQPPSPRPVWIPKARLWLGYAQYKATGAAAVIEARVQEQGGEPRAETVVDRATRLGRDLNFESERAAYRNSSEAVSAAEQAFELLADTLRSVASEIGTAASSVNISVKKLDREIVLVGLQLGLRLSWAIRWANTLDKSELEMSLWDSHPPFGGPSILHNPRRLQLLKADFDLLRSGTPGWVIRASPPRTFSTPELADFLLKSYMDGSFRR